ncbi:hypothetical protein SAMN02745975_03106 [Geosporobacter subterraneus DSM 17957]|uniref:DUF5626 domain-containing protein n=1 Tax=Geosporobacter subterraneus DSM 17957 TaxID=1121919 RepID=A0A1M6MVQ1_9FIRM|nr:hypothetical protein [Geosporobacter subterraneus]SHJ87541.1 hypothetical protein SAMN02745975_03106 [Geosporobacter subterraneus DSM 17957]
MKKMSIICLVALLLCINGITTAFADELPEAVDQEQSGILFETDKMKIDIEFSPESYKYIRECTSSLIDNGNGVLYATISTTTLTTVSSINMDMYIERWNGSAWVTAGSWTQTGTNTSKVTSNKVIEAVKGQKYRVRTVHTVSKDGFTEFQQTLSMELTPR